MGGDEQAADGCADAEQVEVGAGAVHAAALVEVGAGTDFGRDAQRGRAAQCGRAAAARGFFAEGSNFQTEFVAA